MLLLEQKNNKFLKTCLKISLLGAMLISVLALHSKPLYAVEDGAYLVSRTTAYVNPETGQTADGGSNISLGESMCASIVDTYALVEQVSGKTYVTIGIGQMSNISSVSMNIQTSAGGGYQYAPATVTGTSTMDGDTVNHYRIEVVSADLYISPVLYVDAMGREVQFFIKLNTGSMTPGTGVFNALMVSQSTANDQTQQQQVTQDNSGNASTAENQTAENTTTDKDAEVKDEEKELEDISIRSFDELYEKAEGLTIYENQKKEKTSNSSSMPWGIILGGVVCLAGFGYFVYIKKFRGAK